MRKNDIMYQLHLEFDYLKDKDNKVSTHKFLCVSELKFLN